MFNYKDSIASIQCITLQNKTKQVILFSNYNEDIGGIRLKNTHNPDKSMED